MKFFYAENHSLTYVFQGKISFITRISIIRCSKCCSPPMIQFSSRIICEASIQLKPITSPTPSSKNQSGITFYTENTFLLWTYMIRFSYYISVQIPFVKVSGCLSASENYNVHCGHLMACHSCS